MNKERKWERDDLGCKNMEDDIRVIKGCKMGKEIGDTTTPTNF